MSYFDIIFDKKVTGLGKFFMRVTSKQNLNKLRKFRTIKSLLEIGPGRGYMARYCVSQNLDYTAIECNQKLCDFLKKDNIKSINALVPPFPPNIGSYDAVVASHVLEHMSTFKEAVSFVNGIHQILNEDGLVLIISPDIRYSKEFFWTCNYSHNYVTSVSRIVQLLKDNNFEICMTSNRCECFFYPFSHIFWFLSHLIPYRLLERITGRNYEKKSFWTNIRISLCPSAFVIAKKK